VFFASFADMDFTASPKLTYLGHSGHLGSLEASAEWKFSRSRIGRCGLVGQAPGHPSVHR
jgi:hypothetical protein